MSDNIKFEGEFSNEFPPIPTEPSKETDLFFSKIFNQKFNEGVDACIEACKKEFDYWDTEGGTVTIGDLRFNLNLLFEQLKKPLQ